eukprot:gb/GEZN01001370.1/.p1 GENE.gb/GEZN01001370.1/~~gb/GEZN01001370.1/.p1  ORF type:complete len:818 (-),score=51.94 gb/GEZN01001370.1/:583-3036(-)
MFRVESFLVLVSLCSATCRVDSDCQLLDPDATCEARFCSDNNKNSSIKCTTNADCSSTCALGECKCSYWFWGKKCKSVKMELCQICLDNASMETSETPAPLPSDAPLAPSQSPEPPQVQVVHPPPSDPPLKSVGVYRFEGTIIGVAVSMFGLGGFVRMRQVSKEMPVARPKKRQKRVLTNSSTGNSIDVSSRSLEVPPFLPVGAHQSGGSEFPNFRSSAARTTIVSDNNITAISEGRDLELDVEGVHRLGSSGRSNNGACQVFGSMHDDRSDRSHANSIGSLSFDDSREDLGYATVFAPERARSSNVYTPESGFKPYTAGSQIFQKLEGCHERVQQLLLERAVGHASPSKEKELLDILQNVLVPQSLIDLRLGNAQTRSSNPEENRTAASGPRFSDELLRGPVGPRVSDDLLRGPVGPRVSDELLRGPSGLSTSCDDLFRGRSVSEDRLHRIPLSGGPRVSDELLRGPCVSEDGLPRIQISTSEERLPVIALRRQSTSEDALHTRAGLSYPSPQNDLALRVDPIDLLEDDVKVLCPPSWSIACPLDAIPAGFVEPVPELPPHPNHGNLIESDHASYGHRNERARLDDRTALQGIVDRYLPEPEDPMSISSPSAGNREVIPHFPKHHPALLEQAFAPEEGGADEESLEVKHDPVPEQPEHSSVKQELDGQDHHQNGDETPSASHSAGSSPSPGREDYCQPASASKHFRKKSVSLFECSYPGCNQSFPTRFSLKRHQKRHTGERPFECSFGDCDRKFAEKSTLDRHRRTHTGEKPYSCKLCGRKFADRVNLVKHSRTHEEGGEGMSEEELSDYGRESSR